MTPGDRRRWATLQRLRLQDELRWRDYQIEALRAALGKVRREGQRAYREQHASDLRARLNAILRERHTTAARLNTAERESAR